MNVAILLKNIGLILLLLFSVLKVNAQQKDTFKRSYNDSVQTIEPITIYAKRPIVNDVPRVSLRYSCYSSCVMVGYRMTHGQFTWSVNKTAGTFAGVQSINDAIPSIRGSGPEGTAYYIDGVRIHELEIP